MTKKFYIFFKKQFDKYTLQIYKKKIVYDLCFIKEMCNFATYFLDNGINNN